MSTEVVRSGKKVTSETLRLMKKNGQKISVVTAYDYTFAKIFDAAGIDIILVGDSASNVMMGNETTLPITLDEMIYHAKCVAKAVKTSFILVDLPFGSYQGNVDKGLQSAIRVMKESNAHAVKLEGGEECLEVIRKITQAGIPVMGHLGLTPQSIYQFGSYTVRAKEKKEADLLVKHAKQIEEAGGFGVVLEKIPEGLAKVVSEKVGIPTIGIGAGKYCDGQVLVMHDFLGLNKDFKPRFVRRYLELYDEVLGATKKYNEDVKKGHFPNEGECY